jgi:hypothetical protein
MLNGQKEVVVKELTMKQRRAVPRVTARDYQHVSKKEKGRILSTFVKQTKLKRKYAAWLLRGPLLAPRVCGLNGRRKPWEVDLVPLDRKENLEELVCRANDGATTE